MPGGISTDEVITRARDLFGETAALTLTDDTLRLWVNDAIKDLYDEAPPTEFRDLISQDSLALSSGSAQITDGWDRILEVLDSDGLFLHPVAPEAVQAIDLGTFWEPMVNVYALTQREIMVRPTTITSVLINHQEPPSLIESADTATDIETLIGINARWHTLLVSRLTYWMYAQEEDWNSAQGFLTEWNTAIEAAWRGAGYGAETRRRLAPASEE